MTHWSLYVDESGGFERYDGSLVAGLLVPARARDLDSPRIGQAFAKIWGPAPSPPHAGIYGAAVGQALLAAIPERKGHLRSGRHAAARRVASRRPLDLLADSPFSDRLAELREGRRTRLSYVDLRNAEAALRAIPGTRADIAQLDEVAGLQRAEMALLVRSALSQLPGTRVLLVRADHDTEPAPIPGTRLFRDRYLDALEVLLGRLHRILGDGDTCELHVLTRDVQTTGVGAGPATLQFGGLLLRELVEVVRAATGSAAACRPGSAVQHYRNNTDYYDDVHPFLVLADWVATTCRTPTRDGVTQLSALERHLAFLTLPEGSLRGRVCCPPLGVLPLLGAAGPAEARIEAALRRSAALPPAPVAPTWVAEQCSEWVAAAGGAA